MSLFLVLVVPLVESRKQISRMNLKYKQRLMIIPIQLYHQLRRHQQQQVQRQRQHTKLIQDRPCPFMDMDGVPVYGIQRAIQTKEHGTTRVKD